jgi:hypothetical protein
MKTEKKLNDLIKCIDKLTLQTKRIADFFDAEYEEEGNIIHHELKEMNKNLDWISSIELKCDKGC